MGSGPSNMGPILSRLACSVVHYSTNEPQMPWKAQALARGRARRGTVDLGQGPGPRRTILERRPTGRDAVDDCEYAGTAPFAEPLSTVTSLAFVVAGVAILVGARQAARRPDGTSPVAPRVTMGVLAVLVGFG